MELMVLAYISTVFTWFFIEFRKYKKELSDDRKVIIDNLKNINEQVNNLDNILRPREKRHF